jgi:hypothetical protein
MRRHLFNDAVYIHLIYSWLIHVRACIVLSKMKNFLKDIYTI